jgi:hypothetical protein
MALSQYPRALRVILIDQYAGYAQSRRGERRGYTGKSIPAFDRANTFRRPVIMLIVITTRYLTLRKVDAPEAQSNSF